MLKKHRGSVDETLNKRERSIEEATLLQRFCGVAPALQRRCSETTPDTLCQKPNLFLAAHPTPVSPRVLALIKEHHLEIKLEKDCLQKRDIVALSLILESSLSVENL